MIKTLIGRNSLLPDYGHPRSRDWALPDFPCKRVDCVANRYEKCISPARCSIGEDGKCLGYIQRK